VNRPQQSTTTGSSHYGPPHSISHIHYIFSTFSHSPLLQVFLILYITQPPTPFTYHLHTTQALYRLFPVLHIISRHITSLLQLLPTLNITPTPSELFPALHIISPPFFSYFAPYVHITSPPFFSHFPSYTLHHLPFSTISILTHHIISLFQLFPALHITSPSFFSYFPPYTSRHLLFQSLRILYTRQPPSPVISHLIRHYVTPFFSSFPS
jgi:hypothetical protein